MKDAYSFHLDQASLQQTYDTMYATYCRIFDRLGLEYRAVIADTGSIGGSASHEFHVLADSGEDAIAFSDSSSYAANVEMAEAVAPGIARPPARAAMTEVATPGAHSIEEVGRLLGVPAAGILKTLIVRGDTPAAPLVALALRGDHALNEIKAGKLPGVASPVTLVEGDALRAGLGCGAGSLGPVGLDIPLFVDRAAAVLADFCCGANRDGYHLTGVNWERDHPLGKVADLREVAEGDPSPDGQGHLVIKRGIEVGHIFQLGTKYSQAMNATVQNESGENQVMTMGCYGIGVSRVVAAAIEQNHDAAGICWPAGIAPFTWVIVPLNMHKSAAVAEQAQWLYGELQRRGVDVLLDDRDERPGVKFADMELIGIPHRLVIGERGIKEGKVEYKGRRDPASTLVDVDAVLAFIEQKLLQN